MEDIHPITFCYRNSQPMIFYGSEKVVNLSNAFDDKVCKMFSNITKKIHNVIEFGDERKDLKKHIGMDFIRILKEQTIQGHTLVLVDVIPSPPYLYFDGHLVGITKPKLMSSEKVFNKLCDLIVPRLIDVLEDHSPSDNMDIINQQNRKQEKAAERIKELDDIQFIYSNDLIPSRTVDEFIEDIANYFSVYLTYFPEQIKDCEHELVSELEDRVSEYFGFLAHKHFECNLGEELHGILKELNGQEQPESSFEEYVRLSLKLHHETLNRRSSQKLHTRLNFLFENKLTETQQELASTLGQILLLKQKMHTRLSHITSLLDDIYDQIDDIVQEE